MPNEPLPNQVDIRKLVVKGAEIAANVPISSLPRFASLLLEDGGSLSVKLSFYRDEQGQRRVDGEVSGEVQVACQRCLEPVSIAVDSRFQLGVVWSEDDPQRLSADIEPLIVGEELSDLPDIVSEELILGQPFVSYHDTSECQLRSEFPAEQPASGLSTADGSADEAAGDNPFKVLEQLKSSK